MSESHPVKDADDGIRLDRWFKRHFPAVPHGMLEKNLRKGQIRLDGKKAKASDRVAAGQTIEIRGWASGSGLQGSLPPKPKARSPKPEIARMVQDWVLYKDERLIVINKPHGLAVQGGSKVERSVDGMLDALMFNKEERPKLTHRLDRDTSGCLVLARDRKAAAALMKLFSGRTIEKTYLALINNVPEDLHGTIDLPLLKKEKPKATGRPGGPDGRDYEVIQVDEEGQKALTEYHVIDMLARKFALVELKPHTGRMHQLRVHMAAIGCPIVGDHKYGGSTTDAASIGVENRLHLHARRLEIPAFGGGRKVDISAPLPPHMQASFVALGLDLPKK